MVKYTLLLPLVTLGFSVMLMLRVSPNPSLKTALPTASKYLEGEAHGASKYLEGEAHGASKYLEGEAHGVRFDRGDTRPPECSVNSNCLLRNGCMATDLGVCYKPHRETTFRYEPNPLQYNTMGASQQPIRQPHGGIPGHQLVCAWQPRQASAPPKVHLHDESPESVIAMFKLVTSAFVDLWYDWDSPIKMRQATVDATTSTSSTFQMTGSHQGPDMLYKIRNLCVRPSGKLTGFQPQMEKYEGGTEARSEAESQWDHATSIQFLEAINRFLNASVEPLQEEPRWFVDQKLAIMPVGAAGDYHPGHALSKIGGLIETIDVAFPRPEAEEEDAAAKDSARKDVTTMFVQHYVPMLASRGQTFQSTEYGRFLSLATTTHFTTFDGANDGDRPKTEFNEIKSVLQRHPVCFKEAVVYQSCYLPDCLSQRRHNRSAWPLVGFRQPRTQQRISRRFRACAAVSHLQRTSTPNWNSVKLLYSYRSQTRGFFNQASILGAIWQRLLEVSPNGRVYQFEMRSASIPYMVALYSSVDMVIGVYSSGFQFAFLLPPGSMGMELYWPFRGITGLDHSKLTDYGSLFVAGRSHLAIVGLNDGASSRWNGQLAVPHALFQQGVTSMVCLVNQTVAFFAANGSSSLVVNQRARNDGVVATQYLLELDPFEDSVGKLLLEQQRSSCEITPALIANTEAEMYYDDGGVELRRTIRLHLPTYLARTDVGQLRLVTLYANADQVSRKLRTEKWRSADRTPQASPRPFVIRFSCKKLIAEEWGFQMLPIPDKTTVATPTEILELLQIEVRVWRLLLATPVKIRVMVDDTCPRSVDPDSMMSEFNAGLVHPDAGRIESCVKP